MPQSFTCILFRFKKVFYCFEFTNIYIYIYIYTQDFKNLTVLTTHLSQLLRHLSPQHLNAFPWLNGNTALGHLKTYGVVRRYKSGFTFLSQQYTSVTNFWAKTQKQEKADNWEMKD